MKKRFLLIAALVCALPLFANAQFNSGSTGADGALDLSTMTCPSNICYVQLPESGILNYTTVNVSQGKTLIFKLNSRNTPAILLAQGNVTITGIIDINYRYASSNNLDDVRTPGPGGFYGGNNGRPGLGPGGGQLAPSDGYAKWIGSLSLVPIIGGSGGAGYGNGSSAYGGGAGGGALVIASSTSINIQGNISAQGLNNGSGGAVRLVANSIGISGTIRACGGDFGSSLCGVIRLEAPQGAIDFTGTATPTAIFATINPVIILSNPPTLRIASIGGYAVPDGSAGRPDRVDLMLPSQLADPIQVQIQGGNVPSGTQVQLQLSGSSGTATGCTLTGGPGPVACNATVSGLNRTGVSTLLAVAVFNPPSQANVFNPKGANQVAKVRLETALGKQTKYAFLRANGSEIDSKKLSPQFLQQFGM